MDTDFLIPLAFFGFIFGIVYLYFNTRHKERAMLIEKGVDASIFYSGERKTAPVWKILILNIALLLTGIGLGIFLSILFQDVWGVQNDAVVPACIFLMAGVGLLVGYFMTKKL
jgi:flagellar biosynthesis protein FliQ